MSSTELRDKFFRFAADSRSFQGYDANCEVSPEFFFPKNTNIHSDGKSDFSFMGSFPVLTKFIVLNKSKSALAMMTEPVQICMLANVNLTANLKLARKGRGLLRMSFRH